MLPSILLLVVVGLLDVSADERALSKTRLLGMPQEQSRYAGNERVEKHAETHPSRAAHHLVDLLNLFRTTNEASSRRYNIRRYAVKRNGEITSVVRPNNLRSQEKPLSVGTSRGDYTLQQRSTDKETSTVQSYILRRYAERHPGQPVKRIKEKNTQPDKSYNVQRYAENYTGNHTLPITKHKARDAQAVKPYGLRRYAERHVGQHTILTKKHTDQDAKTDRPYNLQRYAEKHVGQQTSHHADIETVKPYNIRRYAENYTGQHTPITTKPYNLQRYAEKYVGLQQTSVRRNQDDTQKVKGYGIRRYAEKHTGQRVDENSSIIKPGQYAERQNVQHGPNVVDQTVRPYGIQRYAEKHEDMPYNADRLKVTSTKGPSNQERYADSDNYVMLQTLDRDEQAVKKHKQQHKKYLPTQELGKKPARDLRLAYGQSGNL